MSYFIDAIGIFGVGLVVIAYFAITTRKLTAEDVRYHLLNFIGATLIFISIYFNWNTASALIEGIWMLISGWGIWRCCRQKKA